ncbi:hypothetical protein AQPE_3547 [Aquipluma nitroreducens]|uniref:Uncharacterized protein n=1 Tax=Aquipluma nitroreducens TaxID=2010828 RepID=A0A5K7SCN9_9BACT|nr:hypothetical protein AQPE_3547 [Aquipluma nitroreducens]
MHFVSKELYTPLNHLLKHQSSMNIFSEQAFNFLLNFNTKTYCIILKSRTI